MCSDEQHWFQYISITLSVVSLTWTWTNYQYDHFGIEKIFVLFIHLFVVGKFDERWIFIVDSFKINNNFVNFLVARVLTLSLFASVFQWWILLFCLVHVAVMKTAALWPMHESLMNPFATADTQLSSIEKFFMRYVLPAVAQLFNFFFFKEDLLLPDSNDELKKRYFLYYKVSCTCNKEVLVLYN